MGVINFRLGSKTEVANHVCDVRFTPKSGSQPEPF